MMIDVFKHSFSLPLYQTSNKIHPKYSILCLL